MKSQWRTILFVLAMFVVVLLLLDFSRRIEEMDRLEEQLATVEAEAADVMGTQVGLMTQIAYATSEAAVAEWAYVDGRWVRPGEHLVEIIPAEDPAATAETDPTTTEQSEPAKWQIWWELFFGDKP